jgi:glycosyltransferase involved in cell wall biosynthesis
MPDSLFSAYQDEAILKPNPSNQNFYSKLIKTLAINNNVSVVSHRPFAKGMFRRKTSIAGNITMDGNVKYYMTDVKASKVYKLLQEQKVIEKVAKGAINDFISNDFVIVTDTLRLNLLKAAKKIARKYNVPVVGMLTDNPMNLSNGHPVVKKYLLQQGATLDGYLSLTDGLVNAYNKNVPSYVFEGLVNEESEGRKDPIFNYFYFGGSLYERYGVKTMVEAFRRSNVKNKLVIAGNGPLDKWIEQMAEEDYRILYLSQLNKEKNVGYLRNSIANINPRPVNPDLDKESVPSKLLEYLSIGTPVISTKYPKFYSLFKDDVTWIDGNDIESMKIAFESYNVQHQEMYLKKAATARRKVFEFYGLNVQAESIDHFLAEINSSKS